MKASAFPRSTFLTDGLTDTFQFLCHLFVGCHDFVEGVGYLSLESCPGSGQPNGEIAIPHGLKARENHGQAWTIARRGCTVAVFWVGILISFNFCGCRG